MKRFFNTMGPCERQRHYMLPPERQLSELDNMVQRALYFVVHAARQTGTTTAMQAFAASLRQQGYAAVWATLEESQGVTEVEEAEPLWIAALTLGAQALPLEQRPPPATETVVGARWKGWLEAWCRSCPAPVVLLLDKSDVFSGQAMVSFLRQLRAGFMDRALGKFPVSVGLIGTRDLRDYSAHTKDSGPIDPVSLFNIKKASIVLRDFTADEVVELYGQHTADTGQAFTPEAAALAFDWKNCVALGLVRLGWEGAEIANPLYREVLVQELTLGSQENPLYLRGA